MLVVPMGLMAQIAPKVQVKNSTEIKGSKLYGEIIIQEFQGAVSVKVDFGKAISGITAEKMILNDVETLRKARFNSVADALNTVSSFGWTVELSYDTVVRSGTITTIVISKDGQKLRRPEAPSKKASQNGLKGKK